MNLSMLVNFKLTPLFNLSTSSRESLSRYMEFSELYEHIPGLLRDIQHSYFERLWPTEEDKLKKEKIIPLLENTGKCLLKFRQDS